MSSGAVQSASTYPVSGLISRQDGDRRGPILIITPVSEGGHGVRFSSRRSIVRHLPFPSRRHRLIWPSGGPNGRGGGDVLRDRGPTIFKRRLEVNTERPTPRADANKMCYLTVRACEGKFRRFARRQSWLMAVGEGEWRQPRASG